MYAVNAVYLLDTSANRNLTMSGWCRGRILDDDMALCVKAERDIEDGGTFLMLSRDTARNPNGHRLVKVSPLISFAMRASGKPLTILTEEKARKLARGEWVEIPELDARFEEVTGRDSGITGWGKVYGP